MSKKCPECGSLNVEEVFDGEAYCKNCYLHCSVFDLEDALIFDHVTSSIEALAAAVVYPDWAEYMGGDCWTSPFVGHYHTKEEAIAATIEKLEEIYNE